MECVGRSFLLIKEIFCYWQKLLIEWNVRNRKHFPSDSVRDVKSFPSCHNLATVAMKSHREFWRLFSILGFGGNNIGVFSIKVGEGP